MKRNRFCLALPLALILSGAAPVLADQPRPADDPAAPTIAGWDALVDGLRALPAQLLSQLPPDERNDPQVREEVGRLALAGLAVSSLDALAGDGNHPVFLPAGSQVLDVIQPNADTIYRVARITPGGIYRLRGRRGDLRTFMLGQSVFAIGENGAKANSGAFVYDDFNALHAGADGSYDIILSPTRPAGYAGDWWRLDPSDDKLLLRMVSDDWANESAPTVSIERVDRPVEAPRTPAALLEERLRRLPAELAATTSLVVGHVEKVRREGYLNKFYITDFKRQGGLQGQFYYESAYELADDQALILAVKLPAKCLYYSIILTDEIYETTDWTDNESSLNDKQLRIDKDGVMRVVIAAKDPGVPNWLDTAGYPLGVIQGRWGSCASHPTPTLRLVSFADLHGYLPADTASVTPAQRDEIIRDRRAAFDQRPLW